MMDPISKTPLRLRGVVETKLGAAMVALAAAEGSLRSGAEDWPSEDADMTAHEIEEARARIAGIKARVAAELAGLAKNATAAA
jgi:hypothetical protein